MGGGLDAGRDDLYFSVCLAVGTVETHPSPQLSSPTVQFSLGALGAYKHKDVSCIGLWLLLPHIQITMLIPGRRVKATVLLVGQDDLGQVILPL
jgi:hypothetical protein